MLKIIDQLYEECPRMEEVQPTKSHKNEAGRRMDRCVSGEKKNYFT